MGISVIEVFRAAVSVFGISLYETPAYAVVLKDGPYEIRRYDPYIVARTSVTGAYEPAMDKAFFILADYIFGKNVSGSTVAMTAPVVQKNAGGNEVLAMTAPVFQEQGSDGWIMEFAMPAKYTLETLPVPVDPSIRFEKISGETIAALRYSGTPRETRIAEKQKALADWVEKSGWRALSNPYHAQYDPPFTIPFLKRNEAMIRVTK